MSYTRPPLSDAIATLTAKWPKPRRTRSATHTNNLRRVGEEMHALEASTRNLRLTVAPGHPACTHKNGRGDAINVVKRMARKLRSQAQAGRA